MLCGFALAADYIGVVPLFVFFGYLILNRVPSGGWWAAIRESLVFVAGSVPPVLFLLYSQWSMYGHPMYPGQYWMPDVNFTERGWRGMTLPALDLYGLNLFSPDYGMYRFGPLLLLGLIPAWWYRSKKLILPRIERRFVAVFVFSLLTFCAMNQYSRMQFNTGFRYLVPLVPFIYLAATDHLVRMSRFWKIAITTAAILQSWVVAVMREPVPLSWGMFLSEGPKLPWLSVLAMTSPEGSFVAGPVLPTLLIGATLGVCYGIWKLGGAMEARSGSSNLTAAAGTVGGAG